jgi:putative DNA primase/helicase
MDEGGGMMFTQFAESHGVIIKSLKASDKIQRCPTVAHPKSDNGAYLWDGNRGGVMAWDGDGQWYWFKDQNAKPWTDAEKRAWAMKQREAEEARERGYRRAATEADITLRSCKQQEHGYLKMKGFVHELGMVDADDTLHIPMRDWQTNHLRGTQRISWDGESWQKKMTYGMKAKGAIFRLGSPRARETWLVEGYATGLSVKAALTQLRIDSAVAVCFSDSNLAYVAPLFKGPRYVFADNDKSGAGERAAVATNCPWTMAGTVGHDANDLHAADGIFAVCDLIMGLRRTRAAA